MPVNRADALLRIVDGNPGPESNAAIIAPGAFRFRCNILSAIINGVRIDRIWRRWRSRVRIVWAPTYSFMIWSLWYSAALCLDVCGAVIIRKRHVTVASGKLSVKSTSRRVRRRIGSTKRRGRKVVSEANGVEGGCLLCDKGSICPGIDGGRRTIIKADLVLVKGLRKHHHAARIKQRRTVYRTTRGDLLQAGHVRVPVHAY